LIYRRRKDAVEVLLEHPGGPFWAKKNSKAWGLVKGEFIEGEEPLAAAKREFKEELGKTPPEGEYIDLGSVKIPGKTIYGWAVEADFDNKNIQSNLIVIDWPPGSGQKMKIPEVDKAEWFDITQVDDKMHNGQDAFIDRLAEHLGLGLEKT
jgi:predicted NUDIX family NTP pyrophosphohydrolase